MLPYKIALFHWLPLGITIVGLSGLVYIAVHANYRQSLDDPQVQIARDAALALGEGYQPQELITHLSMDAGESLSPFLAIYDKSGSPLEYSATVSGEAPRPPVWVFEAAKAQGENRMIWQPDPSTRIALVVVSANVESGWFAASGRNTREVEEREIELLIVVKIVTFLLVFITLGLEFFGAYRKSKLQKS